MVSRIKHLRVFLKDPNKKGIFKMMTEMIHFAYIKKSWPTDYFRKFLYRVDIKNHQDYLSLKEQNAILNSRKLVFPEISSLLNNKLSFKLLCKEYCIPTATMTSYNLKNTYTINGIHQTIYSSNELLSFFENILKSTPNEHLFLKPVQGIGGSGCLMLTLENLIEQLDRHTNDLLTNSYIHERYIKQHPDINQINPYAINTLRILHYIDGKQTVHVISTLMRFGVGTSITDNLSGGGFSIAVNNDTGTLMGLGQQWITKGGDAFQKHPNSGFVLEGFKIPYFNEAIQLVKQVAPYFPNRIVGWDIAITASGPIILEGNHNPAIHLSDMAYGGYGKHPLIKAILQEIKKDKTGYGFF